MSKVYQKIRNKEHFKQLFSSWEASETIIDKSRAIWELKKPGSKYQKVCLFKDDYTLFVYGDFGHFSFDIPTWNASVHNLEYNNPDYLFNKLNKSSKDTLYIFDSEKAQSEIIDWIKKQMNKHYSLSDYSKKLIVKFIKEYDSILNDKNDFLEKHPSLEEISDFIDLACELYSAAENDKSDYISFLRNNTSIEEFEELYDSVLWNAGMTISQTYYVNLYALEICSKKLEQKDVK